MPTVLQVLIESDEEDELVREDIRRNVQDVAGAVLNDVRCL